MIKLIATDVDGTLVKNRQEEMSANYDRDFEECLIPLLLPMMFFIFAGQNGDQPISVCTRILSSKFILDYRCIVE